MTEHKNQSEQSGGKPNPQGSGSDTVSVAKNPTSPVGQSPKPHEGSSGASTGSHGSGSDTASAAGLSSGGNLSSGGSLGGGSSGQSHSPQSSTLASHTARPLGGTQGVGAGSSASSAGSSGHSTAQGGRGAAQSAADTARQTAQGTADSVRQTAQGAADTARQTAQSAADTARQTADEVQRQARDTYEQASSWASDQYEAASRNLDYASRRSMQEVERARHGVERFIQENPVLVGVMGLAAGLVIGALLPRTRQEDRTFGRWADEVREQGARYARDMTQRGREYVEEAFSGDDARFATHDRERRSEDRGGPRPEGGAGRFPNP